MYKAFLGKGNSNFFKRRTLFPLFKIFFCINIESVLSKLVMMFRRWIIFIGKGTFLFTGSYIFSSPPKGIGLKGVCTCITSSVQGCCCSDVQCGLWASYWMFKDINFTLQVLMGNFTVKHVKSHSTKRGFSRHTNVCQPLTMLISPRKAF